MGNLLYWALMFLIVALIAAALGFGGVAGTAMAGAQLLILGGDRAVCDRPIGGLFEARRVTARGNLIQAGGAAAHVPPACGMRKLRARRV